LSSDLDSLLMRARLLRFTG